MSPALSPALSPGRYGKGAPSSTTLVALCVIGWPVSLLVTNEPPLILSLSWLALIIPALGFVLTAKVEKDEDEG